MLFAAADYAAADALRLFRALLPLPPRHATLIDGYVSLIFYYFGYAAAAAFA